MKSTLKNESSTYVIHFFIFLCFLCSSFWLFPNTAQTGPQEEQMVRETLKHFKQGIEQGDFEEGPLITTEDFYPCNFSGCSLDIELSFEDTSCRIKIKRK